jgi:tRNA A37 threonylcarbamoyladenosine synthetase subunit TsaC/SUA5/YrdC
MEQLSQKYDLKTDAKRVFDCVKSGGIAIVHYDVAYAILCATDDALRRVYEAKQRNYSKASGVVGCREMHEAVHDLPEEKRRMIRAIVDDHKLPLSVIAPFRKNDPFMSKLTPFLFDMATRDGTVNFLLNAGALRDEIAAHCWREQVPFVASSANVSLQGAKYGVDDIEPQVKAVADLIIDYGPSKYDKIKNTSSSQIDFGTMKVVRYGHCFDEIAAVLRNEFGVVLEPKKAVS